MKFGLSRPRAFSRLRHLARRFWNLWKKLFILLIIYIFILYLTYQTCTRASLKSNLIASSSRVNTSGYWVFSKERSNWCNWYVENVVRLRRTFRGRSSQLCCSVDESRSSSLLIIYYCYFLMMNLEEVKQMMGIRFQVLN